MCIALGILGIALCISGMLLGATMEAVRGTFGISGMKNFWESSSSVVDVETLVENHDAGSESGSGDDALAFIVTIRGRKNMHHNDIVQSVRQLEGVRYLEML